MRVAIFGAGALGQYLAVRLVTAGADVALFARDDRRSARNLSLAGRVPGELDRSRLHSITSGPLPTFDLAIIAVKRFQNPNLLAMLERSSWAGTTILSLQNGLSPAEDFSSLGARTVSGTIILSAEQTPGGTAYFGPEARISLPVASAGIAAIKSFAAICDKSGIELRYEADYDRISWFKLGFVASYGGLCAVSSRNVGELRRSRDLMLLLRCAFEETARTAVSAVANVDSRLMQSSLVQAFAALPDSASPSLLMDVRNGRQTEIAWLSGAIVRNARASGHLVPVHRWIDDLLAGSTGPANLSAAT